MPKYELYKVHLNEGAVSIIDVGQGITGELSKVTQCAEPNIPIKPDEIKEGDMIIVNRSFKEWISTSPIKRVAKVSDTSWTIFTQTSTYKLEEVEEQKQQ